MNLAVRDAGVCSSACLTSHWVSYGIPSQFILPQVSRIEKCCGDFDAWSSIPACCFYRLVTHVACRREVAFPIL